MVKMTIREILLESFKPVLTSDEMIDFILDNKLRDWSGTLDYNEAKDIARFSNRWVLEELHPQELSRNIIKPKKRSKHLPVIVGKIGSDYKLLDGIHRIAEANYRGDTKILAYIGTFND